MKANLTDSLNYLVPAIRRFFGRASREQLIAILMAEPILAPQRTAESAYDVVARERMTTFRGAFGNVPPKRSVLSPLPTFATRLEASAEFSNTIKRDIFTAVGLPKRLWPKDTSALRPLRFCVKKTP